MDEGKKVYEIAYLLSPLLPEGEIAAAVERLIHVPIAAAAGQVVSVDHSRFINLAYPMSQVIEHKRTVYKHAYFGASKFELTPTELPALLAAWRKMTEFVRFLIVTAPREPLIKPVPGGVALTSPPVEATPPPEAEPTSGGVMAAAIDRELERILAPAAG